MQSTLAVLLEHGHHERALPLPRIAALTATMPARRFDLAGRGSLATGQAADLVLIDLPQAFTLEARQLHQRHPMSPYLGRSFRGVVRRTIRRGETIVADGKIVAVATGRFVRPAH